MPFINNGGYHYHSIKPCADGCYRFYVKPDNILLRSYGEGWGPEVVLADFGLCCSLQESSQLRKRCGTIGYCAPEVLRFEAYDQGVDMFGLGAVAFLVLEGRPPFERSGDPAERYRAFAIGRTLRAPESLRFRREVNEAQQLPASVRFQRKVADLEAARQALRRLLCPRQDRASADEIRRDEAFFKHVSS